MNYDLFKKHIAVNVKKQREELGYSQRELATRAKVSQKTISNLESIISSSSCNLDVLFTVANALGINVLDLLNSGNKLPLELTQSTLEFATIYQQLPPDKQKLIADTAKAFLIPKNESGQ